MSKFWRFKYCLLACVAIMALPAPASAGHLFTQASSNTPVNLTAGTGITITQLTYEGGSGGGDVSLNFSGDWDTGDAIQLTFAGWTQTYTYDSPMAGSSQGGTSLYVNDPTLVAAGIVVDTNASSQFTVVATAGDFTFEGYRIYMTNATYNGTGADTINQSQVVVVSGFAAVANSSTIGVAEVLDALNGNVTGDMDDVITTLSAMSDENKQLAMKLISPESSQAIGQAAVNTAVAGLDTVQLRLDSMRTGLGVVSSGHNPAASHAEPGEAEGISSGNDALNRHMWLKAFGGKADQDAKDGFAGSNDRIYGTMIGYDVTTSGGWLFGAAFGYADTNVDLTDFRAGDNAKVDTYQLTGYFGHSFGSWYLDGMLTYARQDYNTSRDTHVTGVAHGDFSGDLFGLRLLAGMPISMGNDVTITPYGGVEASHVRQDSYTETDAGVLNLNVAESTADRVRSILGTEFAMTKKLDSGTVFRPSVKLNWRHEFNDEGVTNVTSLAGGGGEFETIGQAINRNVYGVVGRLNWDKSDLSNVAVELNAEFTAGYRSISGQVVGGWRF